MSTTDSMENCKTSEDESQSPPLTKRRKEKRKHSSKIGCTICGLIVESINELQQHTLSDHRAPEPKPQPKLIMCHQCPLLFEDMAQFVGHMRVHFIGKEDEKEKLGCPSCPQFKFDTLADRLEHLTNAHFKVKSTFTECKTCGASYENQLDYQKHYQSLHVHTKLVCSGCDFTTTNPEVMKIHVTEHGQESEKVICAACHVIVPSEADLLRHVEKFHASDINTTRLEPRHPTTTKKVIPNRRKITCSVCDLAFESNSEVELHRLHAHCKINFTGKCNKCDDVIISPSDFMIHCYKHAESSPMACPVCHQTFASDEQRNSHRDFHLSSFTVKKEIDLDEIERMVHGRYSNEK